MTHSKGINLWLWITRGWVFISLGMLALSNWSFFIGIPASFGLFTKTEFILPENISHKEGFMFLVNIGNNRLSTGQHSLLIKVLENGKQLGPANINRNDIRVKGKGRYTFFNNNLYFSSSDNTNPLENQRKYFIQYPMIFFDELIYILTGFVWACLLFMAIIAGGRGTKNESA